MIRQNTISLNGKRAPYFVRLFDAVAPFIFFATVAIVCLTFIGVIYLIDDSTSSKEELFLKGHYKEAFESWAKLAERGNEEAQMMVGMINYLGLADEPDEEKALYWYALAKCTSP